MSRVSGIEDELKKLDELSERLLALEKAERSRSESLLLAEIAATYSKCVIENVLGPVRRKELLVNSLHVLYENAESLTVEEKRKWNDYEARMHSGGVTRSALVHALKTLKRLRLSFDHPNFPNLTVPILKEKVKAAANNDESIAFSSDVIEWIVDDLANSFTLDPNNLLRK